MTGDIAMNGKKVTGMGDPSADAQAANKRYVDTRLKKTGGTTEKMEGILYMGGYKIAGVGDPELSTDAANKRWVESQISEIPDGGGSFIDNHNHGYSAIQGNATAQLNSNQLALLDKDDLATKVFVDTAKVLLPAGFVDALY